MKKGDRVWVVSDGDSLTPVAPSASGSEPVFNDVYVPPVPVTVSAGENLGHMGFYQLPEENGKRSRYQVHIECLSMDDIEKFITNPGRAGEDAPVYLTWQTNTPLFEKGERGMVAGSRKTKASGILTLAKVPGVDAGGNTLTSNQDAAYYQIRPEGGWLPAASVKKVSQYALGELGFVTVNKAPTSFDLIDGIKQPYNVVKGILEQLYKAAQDERRTTHALNKYNYQQLLEMIDSNQDGYYSEQEYLQAVHNISYRDRLYRVIAKHASEWYYGKDDPLWKTYLDTLTRDAPLWKTYLEAFLDKMTWMKAVSGKGVALGPGLWHMHPVVFLEAIGDKRIVHITVDMLYKVFNGLRSPAKFSFLQDIADEINNHAIEYKLDNVLRVNHFFAQIREEMGGMASPVEALNYSEEGLKANFSYFRRHPVEANEYSYTKLNGRITKHANEIAIADRVYANRLGNGNISSGDGSAYRGRGGIHLTGKINYQGFSDYYKKNWVDDIDFIKNPSLLEEGIYCMRSAIYFWLREKLYDIADQGDTGSIVDKITAKVNLNTTSYAKRREHFERIKSTNVFTDAF